MKTKLEKKKKTDTFKTGSPKANKNDEKALTPENKTFKLSIILVVSITGLMLMRAVSSLLPLSDNIASWFFSFMVQVVFMGIVPLMMYRWMISKNMPDLIIDLRLNVKLPVQSYLMAIVIGVLLSIMNTGVSGLWAVLLDSLGYQYPNAVGTLYRTPEILVMEIITTCLFPAVFEEFTDRGLFLAIFNRENDKFKILFVGICFGILHQNIPQLGPAAIAGIIITFMAVKSGSIIPGMIVHFLVNFIIVIREFSNQRGGNVANIFSQLTDLMFQNVFTLLIVFVGSVFIIKYLLEQFALMNLKSRELVDGPSPGGKTIVITNLKESIERNIFEVYGPTAVSEEDKVALAKDFVEAMRGANMQLKEKGEKKSRGLVQYLVYEYMPAYIGIISAMVFTILTFIFRFNP